MPSMHKDLTDDAKKRIKSGELDKWLIKTGRKKDPDGPPTGSGLVERSRRKIRRRQSKTESAGRKRK